MTETRPWPIPAVPSNGVLVGQIADPHTGYRPWSYDEIDHMRRDRRQGLIPAVDLTVLTGDNVDSAGTEADAYVKAWIASLGKCLVGVGNHDIRDRAPDYSRAAWESVYGRPGNDYVDVKGWRFITFCPDAFTTGLGGPWTIPDATWDWIDALCLSAPGPVVLAEHYPPWELTQSQDNYLQPPSKLDALIAARTNIVGMLCGHMHYDLDSAQMTQMLSIGGRLIPVICDISSMLSLNGAGRDASGMLQSISTYVAMTEGSWRVQYRMHGTRDWGGPGGLRVTTMDIAAGTVTHGMG